MRLAFSGLLLAALLADERASFAGEVELVLTVPADTALTAHGLRAPDQVWSELIDGAKRTIDLSEFYVSLKPKTALAGVVERLRAAGARGVRMRMLVEKKMAGIYAADVETLRAIPGMELRILDWSRVEGEGVQHAKYLIADGHAAYLGSQNFDWRSLEQIHELGARIESPRIVAAMQSIFEQDWRAAAATAPVPRLHARTEARTPIDPDAPLRLVASPFAFDPPGVGDSESELVRAIGGARQALDIELLEYCPLDFPKKHTYPPIDLALREASVRGVHVHMLVSAWNTDAPCIDHLKSLGLLPNIEIRIVTFPDAKEGFIPFARVTHAKYLIIDGTTLWMGTSNWSGGYLDHSRNLELIARDPALAAKALEIHRELWASPYAAPIDPTKKYVPPRRQ